MKKEAEKELKEEGLSVAEKQANLKAEKVEKDADTYKNAFANIEKIAQKIKETVRAAECDGYPDTISSSAFRRRLNFVRCCRHPAEQKVDAGQAERYAGQAQEKVFENAREEERTGNRAEEKAAVETIAVGISEQDGR
eukprot:SAG31_NODE_735_length_12488_cov_7.086044_3_plen_138_part_00